MNRIHTLALLPLLVGCSSSNAQKQEFTREPYKAFVVVDAVKRRADPKGGLFAPKLRDVYAQGEDEPVTFCDEGPSIPTAVPVSLFYQKQKGTAERSSCFLLVAVVKGDAIWKDGKPKTQEELKNELQSAEHLPRPVFTSLSRQLTFDWRKVKSVGPPCSDLSGSPSDVMHRYDGRACSIAVVYRDVDYALLLNWKTQGDDGSSGIDEKGPAPFVPEVIENIRRTAGSQYVIEGTRQSLGEGGGPSASSSLPAKIDQTERLVPYVYEPVEKIFSQDWQSAKPSGPPCEDISGLLGDVPKRLSKSGCTVAIYYRASGEIVLVNWKVSGDLRPARTDGEADFTGVKVLQYVRDKYPTYFKTR